MKKNSWKVMAMLLALTMVFSLAACKQGKDASEQQETTKETTQETTEEVKEPITIEAFVGPFNNAGIQEDDVAKDVFEKKFGITIDFIQAGDQYEQKLAALLAVGDLPDLVCFKKKADVIMAIKSSAIMELDDLVNRLGEDILANAGVMVQYNKDNLSGESGKLYSLSPGAGPSGVEDRFMWGFYVKWDLYKELGTPELNTCMDILPLLKQMQELEPETENGQKTIATTIWKDWDGFWMGAASIVGAFHGVDIGGYGLNFVEIDIENKVAKDFLAPDSWYIKGLEFYNKANQMGLLDPDSVTQKWDNAAQKMQEGRLLLGLFNWYADMYNSSEIVKNNPLHGMMPIYPKDAVLTEAADSWVGTDYQWAIGAKTEHADRIMELLNYGYTPEGAMNILNGPRDKYWTVKDGKAAFSDEIMEQLKGGDLSYTLNKYQACFNFLGNFYENPETGEPVLYKSWFSYQKANYTELQKEYADTFGVVSPADFCNTKRKVVKMGDEARLANPLSDKINALTQKCGEVIKTESWKAVLAKSDADFKKIIDDMVSKVKEIGYDEVVEANIKEYEAAKERASKDEKK